jgi:4-hydroxy-2-oxoheptanedioate aldolase
VHPVEICNEVAMRSLENSRKAHLIQEKQPFFGTRLISGASSTAAAPGGSGFDFPVVDLEHAPIDAAQAIHILATRAR